MDQPPAPQNLPISDPHSDITRQSHDQGGDITHKSHDQGVDMGTDPEVARLGMQLDAWCLELKKNVLVS